MIFVEENDQQTSGTLYGMGVIIDREPGESVEAFERRVDALWINA